MDLKYAADGQALEHAVLRGEAAIVLAGGPGGRWWVAAGRQIRATSIDVALAPDGATPTALTARDSVADASRRRRIARAHHSIGDDGRDAAQASRGAG